MNEPCEDDFNDKRKREREREDGLWNVSVDNPELT